MNFAGQFYDIRPLSTRWFCTFFFELFGCIWRAWWILKKKFHISLNFLDDLRTILFVKYFPQINLLTENAVFFYFFLFIYLLFIWRASCLYGTPTPENLTRGLIRGPRITTLPPPQKLELRKISRNFEDYPDGT